MDISNNEYDYSITFKQEILNEFLSCLIADYYRVIKINDSQDKELPIRKEQLEDIKENFFQDYNSMEQLKSLEKKLDTYVDFINIYLDKAYHKEV